MTMDTGTKKKRGFQRMLSSLLAVGLLSATLAAQPTTATRYDNQIQTAVAKTVS